MKKINLIAVSALAVLACGTGYATPPSAALTVQAFVSPSCTINTAQLTFAYYDSTNGVASAKIGTVPVACTYNLPVELTLDAGTSLDGTTGNRQMTLHGGSDKLEYILTTSVGAAWGDNDHDNTFPSAPGTSYLGTGPSGFIDVWGRLPSGQPAGAGSYQDTVTMKAYY